MCLHSKRTRRWEGVTVCVSNGERVADTELVCLILLGCLRVKVSDVIASRGMRKRLFSLEQTKRGQVELTLVFKAV
jgi:hypothetical protein